MNPTIEDVYPALRAVWEINERLVYHSEEGTGRILDGLIYEHEGQKQVIGESDMPRLELFAVGWANALFAGAPREKGKKNAPLEPEINIRFRAAFSRRDFFFRRDPTSMSTPKGALEWVALIQDAIETERTAPFGVDAGICGTVTEPVICTFEEVEPTELAFYGILTVTVKAQPHCRGERHFTRCP